MQIETKKLAKILKIASVKIALQEKMLNYLLKIAEQAERLEKSVEMAQKMWQKGLIEEEDIFEKIAELRELPDKEFKKKEAQLELISDSVFHKISSKNDSESLEGIIASIFEE